MTTYQCDINSGNGGEDTVQADSLREAMVAAIEWAREGDWPDEGAKIEVRVWREYEDGETVEEAFKTVEIESAAQRQDARLMVDGEELAVRTHEFSTEKIIQIEGEIYYMHINGGDNGSYDRQRGDGVWRERPVEATRQLTKQEAICMMLDWGHDAGEIAKTMRRLDA